MIRYIAWHVKSYSKLPQQFITVSYHYHQSCPAHTPGLLSLSPTTITVSYHYHQSCPAHTPGLLSLSPTTITVSYHYHCLLPLSPVLSGTYPRTAISLLPLSLSPTTITSLVRYIPQDCYHCLLPPSLSPTTVTSITFIIITPSLLTPPSSH